MKRQQYEVTDISGKIAEDSLKDYNAKLMCPERPYGTSALNYTLPLTKKKPGRKKK